MRNAFKLSFTALAAASLLAVAVAQASAGRLDTSHTQFRATWASLTFTGAELEIRCRVTLEGSFHTRTIAKVARSLIGAITRATVARPCTGGEAWAFNGIERTPNALPFHLTYEGFNGTLPNIEGIRVLLSRVRFLISNFACQGSYGNATDNISGTITRGAGGALTTLAPIPGSNTASLVTRLGGFFCPGTGTFSGTGEVFQLGNTNRITVTLI